jgi:hypothetical protein
MGIQYRANGVFSMPSVRRAFFLWNMAWFGLSQPVRPSLLPLRFAQMGGDRRQGPDAADFHGAGSWAWQWHAILLAGISILVMGVLDCSFSVPTLRFGPPDLARLHV